jgi:hypothetical protein
LRKDFGVKRVFICYRTRRRVNQRKVLLHGVLGALTQLSEAGDAGSYEGRVFEIERQFDTATSDL